MDIIDKDKAIYEGGIDSVASSAIAKASNRVAVGLDDVLAGQSGDSFLWM